MKHLIHGSQGDCNQTAHGKINQKPPGGSHLISLCLIDHLKSCTCPFFFPGKDQQYKAWHESQGDTPDSLPNSVKVSYLH